MEDIEIDVPALPEEVTAPETYRQQTGETTIDQMLSSDAKQKTQTFAQAVEEKEERIEAHKELAPPSPAVTTAKGELSGPRLDSKSFQSRPREEEVQKTPRQVSDEILQKTQGAAPIVPTERTPRPQIHKQPEKKRRFSMFTKKKEVRPAHPANELPKSVKAERPLKKTALSASGRPKMEDIKFTPKLYGPIDELASLDVSDFRRLGKDPEMAAQKIMNKLDLLAEDSLGKKKEGIDALHSSELYKTYTEILKKSVLAGKPYEEILKQDDRITVSELRAIMKLQKQLKS